MIDEDALAVIVGCGYLGRRLAHKLVPRYREVWFTNRGSGRRQDPTLDTRCRELTLDLNAVETLPLRQAVGANRPVDLFCLLPPTALETPNARMNLMTWMARLPIRRALLTSSTGVYGSGIGGTVTAESPSRPDSKRSDLLVAIENFWRIDSRYRILRLAGLYGPERIIGASSLQRGEALPGIAADYLNLMQVDDAAALLLKFIAAPNAANIELGSDGHPVTRGEYFGYVAQCLNVQPPVFSGEPRKHGANRRCDPASTMARLDWRPDYPTYREGLKAAFCSASAE